MPVKKKIFNLQKVINNSLEEDLGNSGDITSNSVIDKNHISFFKLIVNENAVLSGIDVFKKVFKSLNTKVKIKNYFSDGNKVKKGFIVCKISGNTCSILAGERTALNFICHLSGIATETYELTKLLKGTKTILLDTRKTTPGLRYLEKTAVKTGGGKNDRFNLSEMVLIKDNHIAASHGIKKAVLKVRKKYGKKFKIEVEVSNFNELKEAIRLKPDIIMFDNWSVKDLKKGIKLLPKETVSEVSGLISMRNIRQYANTGAN